MAAAEQQRAEWLGPRFWERFDRLDGPHRRLQPEHERAQRGLDRRMSFEAEEVRLAWQHYCEAIAELDRATGDLDASR